MDGQGAGITPFVPSRQMFNLTSSNLRVDISPFVNEALSGFGSAGADGQALQGSDTGQWGVVYAHPPSGPAVASQQAHTHCVHPHTPPTIPTETAAGAPTAWQQWNADDIEGDEDAELDKKLQVSEQLMELTSKLLTGSFARKQAAAGRKCGIEVCLRVVHLCCWNQGCIKHLCCISTLSLGVPIHSLGRHGEQQWWLQQTTVPRP